jgi:hypothetical protein
MALLFVSQTIPMPIIRRGVILWHFCSTTPRRLDLTPFQVGDFVWCAFPESEHPATPSRHLHICYALAVTGAVSATPSVPAYRSIVAYTTSQPWPYEAEREGLVAFSAEQAAGLGQRRAFWLYLWRVAHLPVTPAWFPRMSDPGGGVVGRVPLQLRRELESRTGEVFRRYASEAEHLGPLRPPPRR